MLVVSHSCPRSSLSETAPATKICSTSRSCSCGSTVVLSEKQREWCWRSHSSCCGYSPFVTGSLSSATVCSPDQPPLASGVPKRVILVRILSHMIPLRHVSYLLFERPSLNCLYHPHIQSHSATTLAYESTTHAANGFPLSHSGRNTIVLLSLCFEVLQWRVESTSHRRLRYTGTRKDMCTPLLSVLEPLSPFSQHRPLSTVYSGRQKKADRRAHTAHAHTPAIRGSTVTITTISITFTHGWRVVVVHNKVERGRVRVRVTEEVVCPRRLPLDAAFPLPPRPRRVGQSWHLIDRP